MDTSKYSLEVGHSPKDSTQTSKPWRASGSDDKVISGLAHDMYLTCMNSATGRKGKVWICSFLPASEGRGIERFATQLRDVLEKRDWRTDIVDIQSVGIADGFLGRMRPLAAWRIGKFVNRVAGPDDIIVCNNFFCWNARRRKSVVVYHMTERGRGMATRHKMGRIRNLLVRTLNSYLDRRVGVGRRIVAVSDMVKKEVEELYGLHVDRVIPNAVNLGVFKPEGSKSEWRRKLGLPEDEFLVLYVGPPDKKKGLDIILEGVLPKIRGSQRLVLVSDIKLSDPSVTVVGRVGFDKIHEYYRACDVLLFPSYYEGWGITVAEALASGLPSIMSLTGVGYDLARDKDLSKYIVNSRNPDEYVRRLRMIQGLGQKTSDLRTASIRFAEENLGPDDFEKSYCAIIAEIADG